MPALAGRVSQLRTESAFEALARANALAAAGRSIINLGIGQPDFATPEHIVEAGREALADGHHGYTPANGIPRLREAVAADLLRRHGVTVSPRRVLVVPGGKVTMFFAALMFGEPGAEILYPNPGFPIYESAIRFSGATRWRFHRTSQRAFPSTPMRCWRRSRREPASPSSTARPTRPAARCRGRSSTGWPTGSSASPRSRS